MGTTGPHGVDLHRPLADDPPVAGPSDDVSLRLADLLECLERVPDSLLERIIFMAGIDRGLLPPAMAPQATRALEVARLAQRDAELFGKLSELLSRVGERPHREAARVPATSAPTAAEQPADVFVCRGDSDGMEAQAIVARDGGASVTVLDEDWPEQGGPRADMIEKEISATRTSIAAPRRAAQARHETQPAYELQRETQYELVTPRSQANQLLGASGVSERRILVASFGDLRLPLASVARFVDSTRMPEVGDLASFPPAALLAAMPRRLTAGLVWDDLDPMEAVRLAVGCDGSVGLRVRLHLDRQGPGGIRARGEVGVFTTVELLGAAILYARGLFRLPERACAPGRYAFRVEHHGVSGARMMCDVPVRVDGAPSVPPDWPRATGPSSERTIRIAGNQAPELTTTDLAGLLDDVAVELAVYFAVQDQVRALRPGTFAARARFAAGGQG